MCVCVIYISQLIFICKSIEKIRNLIIKIDSEHIANLMISAGY